MSINVMGLNVVVTGKIAGESRETAEQKLRDAGAHVHPKVTGTTHLLVMGAKVGATKVNAAQKLGAKAVMWEQLDLSGELRTKSGKVLTRADLEALADEAEVGYSIEHLLRERPPQIAPMKCRDAEGALPVGPDWLYETKWDGYRAIATVKGGKVSLQSGSGKSDYAAQYPHIAEELSALPDCIIDGEIVVLDSKGVSKFQSLIGAANGGKARFIVFDILEQQGQDVRKYDLYERKDLLHVLLGAAKGQYVAETPVYQDGQGLLEVARKDGWEGVVCKRGYSAYQEGARNAHWLKLKVRCGQEFVVIGYEVGEGKRADTFGALLLGVNNDDDELVFCGKVGTGWTDKENARLFEVLDKLRLRHGQQAARVPRKEAKTMVPVHPSMVVQVEFQRWTEDGVLWHPSYQGQRTDKEPSEVRREPCAGS